MNQRNALPKKKTTNISIIIDNTKKGGSLERFCWAGCSVTAHIQHFLNNRRPTLIKLTTLGAKRGKTRSFGITWKEMMPLRARLMDVEWHSTGQNPRFKRSVPRVPKSVEKGKPEGLSLSYNTSGGPDGKKASATPNISRRWEKTYKLLPQRPKRLRKSWNINWSYRPVQHLQTQVFSSPLQTQDCLCWNPNPRISHPQIALGKQEGMKQRDFSRN